MKHLAVLAAVCAALAIALDAEAGSLRKNGSGGGVAKTPGAAPAPTVSPFRHHRSGTFFVGGFWGWPWPYGYYYPPPPYYYGPDYARAQYELPGVYIEKFEGDPASEAIDDIYCPAAGGYYPDVRDCPGGWQRVIR